MTRLTQDQLANVAGGDFWSALTCGVGVAFLITAPEIAGLAASGIAIACVKTFVD